MRGVNDRGGEKLRPREIPRLEGLECYGTARGVLICWDKRSLEILNWEEGQFSISCRFRNVGDGGIWVFTGVYGPFSREERESLWEEIGAIRGLWEEPWCLGGDFNTILYHSERSRNGKITSAMRRFAQIIDDLGLVDFPLQGDLLLGVGGSTINHGPGLRRGPSPFKFENMWLKAEEFKDLIGGWWQGIVVRGSPSYRLAVKLKGLKQNLKIWNKEVFGSLERNKAEALQQVEHWDLVEGERSLTEEELCRKKEAKEDYAKWVSLEEIHWRRLSRELWLREGDRNMGFFHRMTNAHRRVNALDKIKINGVRLTEEQEVREGIANAYQQLLSKSLGWKADIGGLLLKQISHSEVEALKFPFSKVEIHAALMGMNGDKAPGPDGFTVAFWQSCWETVKEDVLDMFNEFHEQNSFIKSLNHTFLVLLSKKGGAEDMGNVVSSDQNAFIKGRQILDASLIANEAKMVGMDMELHIHYQVLSVGERCASWVFLKFERVTSRGPSFPLLVCHGNGSANMLITRAIEGGLFLGVASGEEEGRLREVEGVNEMAAEIGCRVGQLPAVYLGLPLRASNKAISVWDGVEEKVRRRLALWKRQYTSKGGRITLIKSTGQWGKKAHLVKWEVVCADKEKGGLGLRKLACLNKALLGKWIWRFARAKEDLWKKVLEAKYGQKDFGWRTRKANGSNFGGNSVIWKEGGDGLFKVKKAFSVLASPIVAEFPYSNVWVDRVPTKIVFFAWEAAWGRKYTLERMFTSQLLESAKDELSFRTVVRDLRTKSPVLQIVLLNPNSWCCTGYCLGTEDTVDPVANINLYPAIKVLFSDCSYRTESQIRMIEEWVTKNQADEVYMLDHLISELIVSLEAAMDMYPPSYTFLQGLPLSSLPRSIVHSGDQFHHGKSSSSLQYGFCTLGRRINSRSLRLQPGGSAKKFEEANPV
ncbi:hypothetical protein CK203_066866 [Vitis vinifera]|uniref:Uncharacterized protein n=1 Tax=Vitis vinifera TaxID=29760 RepID=A0A438EV81_VITVI|nr:hypothetical protein CK203_066866 [Vitis vinifera]